MKPPCSLHQISASHGYLLELMYNRSLWGSCSQNVSGLASFFQSTTFCSGCNQPHSFKVMSYVVPCVFARILKYDSVSYSMFQAIGFSHRSFEMRLNVLLHGKRQPRRANRRFDHRSTINVVFESVVNPAFVSVCWIIECADYIAITSHQKAGQGTNIVVIF